MDDLIKRKDAIDVILECCPSDYDSEYDAGYDDGLKKAIFKLQRLPSAHTLDAVKHGEWLDESEGYHWYGRCSVCSHELNIDARYADGMNYCPNCGAKMDGKEKDNE